MYLYSPFKLSSLLRNGVCDADVGYSIHLLSFTPLTDSKPVDVATRRKPTESWVVQRRDKPNKSSLKKFVETDWVEDSQQYGKSKKSIYDKKYFDYLPAELKDSPETSADVPLSKRTNSRRIRRGADATDDGDESRRSKRHGMCA